MRHSLPGFALIVAILTYSGSGWAGIIYNLDHVFPVTGGTAGSTNIKVTGTITTDGTLGSISPFLHFDDWSITFDSDNLPARTAVPGNSDWSGLNGLLFEATATELLLPVPFSMQQQITLLTMIDANWTWGHIPLIGGTTNLRVSLSEGGQDDEHFSGPFSTPFTLATVPLPSPALLMLLGLPALALARRRVAVSARAANNPGAA